MKINAHPRYEQVEVKCSCGNHFITRSTCEHDLSLEVCDECHPFYTGTIKLIDAGGRLERFRKKYEL